MPAASPHAAGAGTRATSVSLTKRPGISSSVVQFPGFCQARVVQGYFDATGVGQTKPQVPIPVLRQAPKTSANKRGRTQNKDNTVKSLASGA